MSKLLMIERETTMTYNDKEPLATVQTCNTQLIKRRNKRFCYCNYA